MRGTRVVTGAVLVLTLATVFSDAVDARQWRMTPAAQARDYTQIVDHRSKGELVMIWWVAPELVDAHSPVSEQARSILREYMVVALAHARISPTGRFTYERPAGVLIQTGDGKARQPLRDGALPPAVTGIIATLQATFSQALGAFGQGTEWYVFEGKGIESCQRGAFWIYYAGEQYGYATPIPGCGQPTAASPQG